MIRTKPSTFRLRIETTTELAKLTELLQAKMAAGRVSQADAIAFAVNRALAELEGEKRPAQGHTSAVEEKRREPNFVKVPPHEIHAFDRGHEKSDDIVGRDGKRMMRVHVKMVDPVSPKGSMLTVPVTTWTNEEWGKPVPYAELAKRYR